MILLFVALLQLSGWSVLEDVKFRTVYSEQEGAHIDLPKFGKTLLAIQGSQVTLKGHYLPLDMAQDNTIVLSKFPYASCFFCGGAGMESVVEVHFSSPQRTFRADEVLTVTGTLKLNDSDFEHLIYILENAQRVRWEN